MDIEAYGLSLDAECKVNFNVKSRLLNANSRAAVYWLEMHGYEIDARVAGGYGWFALKHKESGITVMWKQQFSAVAVSNRHWVQSATYIVGKVWYKENYIGAKRVAELVEAYFGVSFTGWNPTVVVAARREILNSLAYNILAVKTTAMNLILKDETVFKMDLQHLSPDSIAARIKSEFGADVPGNLTKAELLHIYKYHLTKYKL